MHLLSARSLAVAGILLLAAIFPDRTPTASAGDPSPLTEEERDFFSWFDGLGYPDLGRLPFVRYRDGRSRELRSGRHEALVWHGFLLEEDARQFTVLLTDLHTLTLTRRDVPGKPWEAVGFESVDVAAFVDGGIEERRRSTAASGSVLDRADPFRAHSWWMFDWTWRMAVLARACASLGHDDVARRLLDLAYQEGLGDDFAGAKRGMADETRIALDDEFVRRDRTYEDLVARVESWKHRFGSFATPPDRSEGDLAVLRTMIAERDAHAKLPPRPLDGMPVAERIAELVFRLRDVENRSRAATPPRIAPAFAADDALVTAGIDAVPALIAALDDPRFTRSLAWGYRDKGWQRPMHTVQRVGDAAWIVLQRISAWGIERPPFERIPPADELEGLPRVGTPSRALVVEAARRWHARVVAEGEVPILQGRVRRGGSRAVAAARRLAAVAPDSAGEAIGVAWREATEYGVRDALLEALVSMPGPEGSEALAALLSAATDPAAKVPLAVALQGRGDRRGLETLLELWPAILESGRGGEVEGIAWRALEAFAGADDARAMEALARYAADGGPNRRLDVILLFAVEQSQQFDDSGGSGYTARQRVGDGPRSAEALVELERLLAAHLEDEFRLEGTGLTIDGVAVDPVLGELAAWALAKRFPDRWHFDPTAPAAVRKRARLSAANAWRARVGRPPLPLPAPPPSADPTDEVLRGQLHRAVHGSTEVERGAACAALRERGISALPGLRGALGLLAGDAPGRTDLERVAAHAALEVTDVLLDGTPVGADDPLRKRLEALRGRTFSGSVVSEAFLAFTAHRPADLYGMRLLVQRSDEGRGAVLRATFARDLGQGGDNSDGWGHSGPWVRRERRTMLGGGGFGARKYLETPDAWTSWASSIDADLDGVGVDEEFEVGGSVRFIP